MPLQPGQPAPDFTLPAVQADGFISLADYRGKSPVLLAMFRGLWCSFCRRQIARLGGTCQKLRSAGVEPLAIVAGNVRRARIYTRFRPAPMPLVADPELATFRSYGLPSVPLTEAIRRAVQTVEVRVPERSEPATLETVSDEFHRAHPYEWQEVDRSDSERTGAQSNGQFLIDRDGIVRWANVEGSRGGLAELVQFPTDEELLAVARTLA